MFLGELNDRFVLRRNSYRTRLGIQALSKRRADRVHAPARTASCLEDHDRCAGFVKQLRCSETREAGANHNDRIRARATALDGE